MNTPWGKSDAVDRTPIAGVTFYSTPSHGGFRVSTKAAEEMDVWALELGEPWSTCYWFEEDCAAWAVIYTWPEIDDRHDGFKRREQEAEALQHLIRWFPRNVPAELQKGYQGPVTICDQCGDESNSAPYLKCGRDLLEEYESTLICTGTYVPESNTVRDFDL